VPGLNSDEGIRSYLCLPGAVCWSEVKLSLAYLYIVLLIYFLMFGLFTPVVSFKEYSQIKNNYMEQHYS
jgi:hypothetical protein